MKKLPSIKEDEEGSEGEHSPLPKMSSLGRLGRGLRSPMRSPLRSPLLPPRPFRPASDPGRPSSLQIPVVSFSCLQPDLSPRFVDGIEAENHGGSSPRFDFSPGATQSFLPSPDSISGACDEGDTMQTIAKLKHEMCVLSRQVTAVSQELQEMTRLLKPLLHTSSSLLPGAVTPPPSMSSHSCSPAPPLFTQLAPVSCSDEPGPQSVLLPEPPPPSPPLMKEFDPLHRSAPPSLHSSPQELPHPYSSSSIPSLSSPTSPLLVDLSEPESHPQSRLLSRSDSQLQFQPDAQLPPRAHPHALSQPLLQTSSMASPPPEALLDLQEVEWGEHGAQLSFIDEGRPSV